MPRPLVGRCHIGHADPSAAKLLAKIIAALLAGLVALMVFLDRLAVIDPTVRQRAWLAASAAAVATASTIAAAAGEFYSQRIARKAEKTLFRLRTLGFALQDVTGIDVRDLGLACYLLRRDRLRPWRRVLRQVARDRAQHRAVASGVTWRPGMGVIGQCVEQGTLKGTDVAAIERDWREVTADDWSEVPPEATMGLSPPEFEEVAGKYHTVLAAPMIAVQPGRGSRPIGCVALDGPAGAWDRLWVEDVRQALVQAADDLAELVV